MNLHEFQAKALAVPYGIPVPRSRVAATPAEAAAAAKELATPVTVVKAQIHAGGRGKAGGVKLAKSPKEAAAFTQAMLGKPLVTAQTGPEGQLVRHVLIEEGIAIEHELYLSLVLDRAIGRLVFIASKAGGVEIEEVAHKTPDKIIRVAIDPAVGYQPHLGRLLGFRLGLEPDLIGPFVALSGGIVRLFIEKDASLIEINPLVVTQEKVRRLIALDVKMTVDDNALFRHDDVEAMRDLDEEDPREVQASRHRLNYVRLTGNIGCMVNGAGLAMATMDVIKLAGAFPANFLDVGGTATKETVKEAFQILLSDEAVRGVFVNIFGGIVRCDRIAGGIIDAAKEIGADMIGGRVPVVVRLEGTNVEEGRKMLVESGLTIHVATDLWAGAQAIVRLVNGVAR